MTNQQGQAAIEARLERAAAVLGDLTAPVIAEDRTAAAALPGSGSATQLAAPLIR